MTNISNCVQLRTIQLTSKAPLARGVLIQHSRISNAYTSVSLDAFVNAAVRMLGIPSVMHTLTRVIKETCCIHVFLATVCYIHVHTH